MPSKHFKENVYKNLRYSVGLSPDQVFQNNTNLAEYIDGSPVKPQAPRKSPAQKALCLGTSSLGWLAVSTQNALSLTMSLVSPIQGNGLQAPKPFPAALLRTVIFQGKITSIRNSSHMLPQ
jgi:hypothetical protein